MASVSKKQHMTWSVAGLAAVLAAGYLGHALVDSLTIPTAKEWVDRAPAIAVDDTLPKAAMDYSLAPPPNPIAVPRVFAADLPTDLTTLTNVNARKDLFIRTILPLVMEANALIERDRARLLALKERYETGRSISSPDSAWLTRIMANYRVEELDWDVLLRRVDTVPPSLALAQAATESGWGTSRFAQQGNALFGQWTWGDGGMVPEERGDDQTHSVRVFKTPMASVFAYMRNLNTHPSYRRFRVLRDEIRQGETARPGYTLASTLDQYSERRDAYMEELRQIMRVNDLHRYNSAVFGDAPEQLAMNTES